MSVLMRVLWVLMFACVGCAAVSDARDRPEMREVHVAQLPLEARRTLELIKKGGPYPYKRDGTTFGNRERLLPQRDHGYYREFTVPTPGARDRGALRIVSGRNGEYYYTADHYDSFSKIRQ